MTAATSPSIQPRWYVSVAAALFVFVVVGVYSIRMANDTTGYDEEQAQARYAKLAALQEQDRKTLGTADWVDKDKGIVRIPIDEAVAEEIPILAAKPVTMGAAIPGAIVPPSAPAAPAAMGAAAPVPASGRASDNNQKPTK
jgi:hypothetical protein